MNKHCEKGTHGNKARKEYVIDINDHFKEKKVVVVVCVCGGGGGIKLARWPTSLKRRDHLLRLSLTRFESRSRQ